MAPTDQSKPSSAAPADPNKTTTKEDEVGAKPDAEEGKKAGMLEEDDEFEDFPVEDWPTEDAELPSGNTHLWEESWDDDDTNDDFSTQLRAELKKLEQSKK